MISRFLKFYNPNNHCLRTNKQQQILINTKNMSASSKAIAKTAAQKGTILSKSVAEEKRYKKSSAAQKALQKPTPLGPPSINPQERAAKRKARLLKKHTEHARYLASRQMPTPQELATNHRVTKPPFLVTRIDGVHSAYCTCHMCKVPLIPISARRVPW